MERVCIIDYGMGNLWSIESALKFLGAKVIITNNREIISDSEKLILPGVGSFFKAIQSLNKLKLKSVIRSTVLDQKSKILGICLGMQLMSRYGFEDGKSTGLGLISTDTRPFSKELIGELRIPHIGFNSVEPPDQSLLFNNISRPYDFYFVHSYYLPINIKYGDKTICTYGDKFLAAFENDNIYATQFHPEKSQTNGLILLKNFLLL